MAFLTFVFLAGEGDSNTHPEPAYILALVSYLKASTVIRTVIIRRYKFWGIVDQRQQILSEPPAKFLFSCWYGTTSDMTRWRWLSMCVPMSHAVIAFGNFGQSGRLARLVHSKG